MNTIQIIYDFLEEEGYTPRLEKIEDDSGEPYDIAIAEIPDIVLWTSDNLVKIQTYQPLPSQQFSFDLSDPNSLDQLSEFLDEMEYASRKPTV